ncbi:MAG TPA: hypothetical protein PLB96_11020 [Syntrophales bacterium]|nr:hypothetical protein [Syntrophales bacterium]
MKTLYWRSIKEAFVTGYEHIGLLMAANVLFVLASLPLVTLPATIPMLGAAVSSIAGGRKPSWRKLWEDAGRHYLRGVALLLWAAGVAGLLAVDLYILGTMKESHPEVAYLIMGFVLCFLLAWLLMQIYVLPFFLAAPRAVGKAFRKSFLLVLDNFGLSLAIASTMLGVVLVMVLSGVGPFVLMVSFLFLLQQRFFANLMERYDEQR